MCLLDDILMRNLKKCQRNLVLNTPEKVNLRVCRTRLAGNYPFLASSDVAGHHYSFRDSN